MSSNSVQDSKGSQTIYSAEQEAADIMKALKESKKMSKRQPGTGGSNEGTGNILGVPDESTVISRASSEGTGSKRNHSLKLSPPLSIRTTASNSSLMVKTRPPAHISSGPGPQLLTPRTIRSGLIPQPPSPTPNVPPTKNDWDLLFCPMLDEYFNPSPSVVQHVLVAVVQEPVVSTGQKHLQQRELMQDTPLQSTLTNPQEETITCYSYLC
ncbi:hypothetical protein Tco_0339618 [Tanacetum coccineum]